MSMAVFVIFVAFCVCFGGSGWSMELESRLQGTKASLRPPSRGNGDSHSHVRPGNTRLFSEEMFPTMMCQTQHVAMVLRHGDRYSSSPRHHDAVLDVLSALRDEGGLEVTGVALEDAVRRLREEESGKWGGLTLKGERDMFGVGERLWELDGMMSLAGIMEGKGVVVESTRSVRTVRGVEQVLGGLVERGGIPPHDFSTNQPSRLVRRVLGTCEAGEGVGEEWMALKGLGVCVAHEEWEKEGSWLGEAREAGRRGVWREGVGEGEVSPERELFEKIVGTENRNVLDRILRQKVMDADGVVSADDFLEHLFALCGAEQVLQRADGVVDEKVGSGLKEEKEYVAEMGEGDDGALASAPNATTNTAASSPTSTTPHFHPKQATHSSASGSVCGVLSGVSGLLERLARVGDVVHWHRVSKSPGGGVVGCGMFENLVRMARGSVKTIASAEKMREREIVQWMESGGTNGEGGGYVEMRELLDRMPNISLTNAQFHYPTHHRPFSGDSEFPHSSSPDHASASPHTRMTQLQDRIQRETEGDMDLSVTAPLLDEAGNPIHPTPHSPHSDPSTPQTFAPFLGPLPDLREQSVSLPAAIDKRVLVGHSNTLLPLLHLLGFSLPSTREDRSGTEASEDGERIPFASALIPMSGSLSLEFVKCDGAAFQADEIELMETYLTINSSSLQNTPDSLSSLEERDNATSTITTPTQPNFSPPFLGMDYEGWEEGKKGLGVGGKARWLAPGNVWEHVPQALHDLIRRSPFLSHFTNTAKEAYETKTEEVENAAMVDELQLAGLLVVLRHNERKVAFPFEPCASHPSGHCPLSLLLRWVREVRYKALGIGNDGQCTTKEWIRACKAPPTCPK